MPQENLRDAVTAPSYTVPQVVVHPRTGGPSMNKLNERLTLIANISVVLGIIFLAFELQQNTQAIQAQTRDSLTEKQPSGSTTLRAPH